MVTKEEILEISKRVSHKYRSYQEFEDMVQTGVLFGLEELAKDENCTESVVVGAIRSGISEYYNLKTKPVSIPNSGEVRSVLAKIKRGEDVGGGYTNLAIVNALVGTTEDIQHETLREPQEFDKVVSSFEDFLSSHYCDDLDDDQLVILHMYYSQDKSMSYIAKCLGTSTSTVSRGHSRAIMSIKKVVGMTLAKSN